MRGGRTQTAHVTHRIGGLETSFALVCRSAAVTHRIGGLEIFEYSLHEWLIRYTPHRWLRNKNNDIHILSFQLHTA